MAVVGGLSRPSPVVETTVPSRTGFCLLMAMIDVAVSMVALRLPLRPAPMPQSASPRLVSCFTCHPASVLLWGTAGDIGRRLLDGVDPSLVAQAEEAVLLVAGITGCRQGAIAMDRAPAQCDATVTSDPTMSVRRFHELEHQGDQIIRSQFSGINAVRLSPSAHPAPVLLACSCDFSTGVRFQIWRPVQPPPQGRNQERECGPRRLARHHPGREIPPDECATLPCRCCD